MRMASPQRDKPTSDPQQTTHHLHIGSIESDNSAIRQSNSKSSSGNPWRGFFAILRTEVEMHRHPHPRYVCNIARIFSQQGSYRRKIVTDDPEDYSEDWSMLVSADELLASTSLHPPPLLLPYLSLKSHRRTFPCVSTT